MNLGEMKAKVRRDLGNLPATDFHIAANDHIGWLNDAVRDVVIQAVALRDNFNLFPELRTSWDGTATQNGVQRYAVPDNKYTITGVECYHKTGAAAASDKTYSLRRLAQADFYRLNKTTTGFPTIWMWEANYIYLWPTPTTDYLTDLLLFGVGHR